MSRKINISAISDLHGNLLDPEVFEPGDVLCICGDIVPLDFQRDLVQSIAWFCHKFVPWTDQLPFKKVLVVFGNHDFFAEEIGPKHNNGGHELTRMLLPGSIKGQHKIEILCDNVYKYMGFNFYGTSWCPDLMNWAFYGDHDKLVEMYDKIPVGVDVLLSHCPPKFGTVGTVLQRGWSWMRDFGCQELANAIDIKKPHWTFCGHVHSGDHKVTTIDNTINIVNVSALDENYKLNYSPFNTEIEK